MKKIMTLLVMFLMTGGILMAQAPKFNYQVVLRNSANELVANQSGTVTVTVGSVPLWVSNDGDFKTNMNGMAAIQLADTSESIDWVDAVIVADFLVGAEAIHVETPVMAVPFALQAADGDLSTPMIVAYVDPNNTDGTDVDRVYQALKANSSVHDAIRDSAVNYIKANYRLAKEVAYAYMHQVTAQDVRDAYDTVRNVDQSVKNAVYELIKRYLMDHPDLAVEIAEYYIETAQVSEMEDLYNTLKNDNPSVAAKLRGYLIDYFEQYLASIDFTNCGMSLCDLATLVSSNTPLEECPTFVSQSGNTGEVIVTATGDSRLFQIGVNNPNNLTLTNPVFVVRYFTNYDHETYELLDPVEKEFSATSNEGVYSATIDVSTDISYPYYGASVTFKASTRCNGQDGVQTEIQNPNPTPFE